MMALMRMLPTRTTLPSDSDWIPNPKGLLPPEEVNDKVEQCKGQRDDLELGYSQALRTTSNTLEDEPGSLNDSDGFRQGICVTSITDLFPSDFDELVINHELQKA